MNGEIRFIDLFAGIGGFRYSFEKCGCKCVFSSEFNKACQDVYENNYGDRPSGDITQIDVKDIPNFDIMCAGFPCQPFSICGKKMGFEDTRGTLFFDVCRIIKAKMPSVVILENVKHLINHDKKQTFNVIIETLKEIGYNTSYKILDSSKFGVAQCRERIIIVATKNGHFDFNDMQEAKPIYIKDILDEDGDFEYLNKNEYTLLDKKFVKRQPTGLIFCGYRNKGIWKKGIRPNTEHLSRVHRQPNRIYSIEGIHPTIPSQESSGRFWIYIPQKDVVRKLTINECYKLMGYPSEFRIDKNKANAYKQCGNSVVIPMITELANSVIRQAFKNPAMKNLEQIYSDSISISEKIEVHEKIRDYLTKIGAVCTKKKGSYTVTTTLLYYKYLHPDQDIRKHQTSMKGGFSGRSFDTQYVTPVLKKVGLPSMAESGWQTRSLEQPYPYDLNYNGKLGELKIPFIEVLSYVEEHPDKAYDMLTILLNKAIDVTAQNSVRIIPLEYSEKITIDIIIKAIEEHFLFHYSTHNGAKLPVLAFHSIYTCIINEVKRYEGCRLADLSSLTACDKTNKASGDIEIFKEDILYEAIEIKLNKKIDANIIRIAREKIYKWNPQRYYVLSVYGIKEEDQSEIDEIVRNVNANHGCQIIINGLLPTIKYYLRLISDLNRFVKIYSEEIQSDKEIQKIHKEKWNELIAHYQL